MNHTRPLVLIADDDEHIIEVLTRRCGLLGLDVETAHDGLAAVKAIDLHAPDLIILDVNMPHGSGLDVCEMIARDEQARQIPVIILTGRQDEDTIRRCHNLLAYYVLKCTNVWSRIEPLIGELLDPTPRPACGGRSTAPAQPPIACSAVADSLAATNAMAAALIRPDQHELEAVGCPAATDDGRPWVLCIDDDSEFSSMLKTRLEERGVNVMQAVTGTEGYRLALLRQTKAILLDYEMASGDGEYTLRRLKEHALTSQVPVIVLTGRRDNLLERRMYNLGAVRFLTKPIDWQHLWDELRWHLVNLQPQQSPLQPLSSGPAIAMGS